MRKLGCLVALAALFAAGCETTEGRVAASGEARAAAVADEAPENVLDAAKKAVPGLVVTGVESEVERGVLIYDVTGTADGAIYEVEVAADGTVNEIEKGDDGEDDDGEDDDGDDDDDA